MPAPRRREAQQRGQSRRQGSRPTNRPTASSQAPFSQISASPSWGQWTPFEVLLKGSPCIALGSSPDSLSCLIQRVLPHSAGCQEEAAQAWSRSLCDAIGSAGSSWFLAPTSLALVLQSVFSARWCLRLPASYPHAKWQERGGGVGPKRHSPNENFLLFRKGRRPPPPRDSLVGQNHMATLAAKDTGK